MIAGITMEHCEQLAGLHQKYLSTPFRGSSGGKLLELYYVALATGSGGTGFAAVDGDDVLGYVCGVWDRDGIIRDMLKKSWHRLIYWGAIQALINPSILRSSMDRLTRERDELEKVYFDYELRPIVVTPEARGTGIAGQLVQRLLKDARSRGYPKVELITEDTNLAANAFYHKIGFEECGTFIKAGVSYKIYEIPTEQDTRLGIEA